MLKLKPVAYLYPIIWILLYALQARLSNESLFIDLGVNLGLGALVRLDHLNPAEYWKSITAPFLYDSPVSLVFGIFIYLIFSSFPSSPATVVLILFISSTFAGVFALLFAPGFYLMNGGYAACAGLAALLAESMRLNWVPSLSAQSYQVVTEERVKFTIR